MKQRLQLFFIIVLSQLLNACNVNPVQQHSPDVNQNFFFKRDFYLIELIHFSDHQFYAVNTFTNCCLPKNVVLPKIQKYYRNPMVWKNWHSSFLTRYRIVGFITQGTRCRVLAVMQKNNRVMYQLIVTTGPFKGRKISLISN